MKLAYILGTRPEIVKASPVIRACKELNIECDIIHTGQHYSPNMDFVFFEELQLPKPAFNLHVGPQPYRKQVGIMIRELRNVLRDSRPDVVIVQGDTLTVLTGALAAEKEHIPIAHLEAGLRSHDLSMPEETNRIITDHISEVLLAPGEKALNNLEEEGIPEYKVFHVGNTSVDAVRQNINLTRDEILDGLGLRKKKYALVTAHRAENVDREQRLKDILLSLALIADEHPELQIIYPMHPRTKKRVEEFGIPPPSKVKVIEPLGYLEFLALEQHAAIIITDSGGLQEEACILHVPCVTIRENTERLETVEAGMNVVAGTKPEHVTKAVTAMLNKNITWTCPYGNGDAGMKTVKKLVELYA